MSRCVSANAISWSRLARRSSSVWASDTPMRPPTTVCVGMCSVSSDDAVAVLADGRHEGERDAVDIGVLRGEEAVLVGFVGAAAQAAADDLLAQELGAERADAEDVGDGVGVPA